MKLLPGKFLICFWFLIGWNNTTAQDSFPYSLKKSDYITGSLGLSLFIGGELMEHRNRNLSLTQIEALTPSQVNKFDRIATRQWSTAAQRFSDIPYRVMPIASAAVCIPQLKRTRLKRIVTLGVMYTETLLLTGGITSITKSWVGRTRPYLYNTSFTSQERFNLQGNGAPIGSTSFISGHTSKTFAFAFLLSKMCTDIYGKKTWCKIVWGTSMTLASLTAVARVRAGVHFPTDVIAGAVVGGAIGYFVPVLHKSKGENLAFFVMPGRLNIQYRF